MIEAHFIPRGFLSCFPSEALSLSLSLSLTLFSHEVSFSPLSYHEDIRGFRETNGRRERKERKNEGRIDGAHMYDDGSDAAAATAAAIHSLSLSLFLSPRITHTGLVLSPFSLSPTHLMLKLLDENNDEAEHGDKTVFFFLSLAAKMDFSSFPPK